MTTRFSKGLFVLALAAAAIKAQAADVTLSGTFAYNTDIVQVDITIPAGANVALYTDSWRAGLNFDPTLAVFDVTSAKLADAVVGPYADDTYDAAALRAGQGGYDSLITLSSLAAGHYLLTLTASGNQALGPRLVDGFSLDGTTPIFLSEWNQPSYDVNANDQKGGFWRLHLDGVQSALQVSPVPEPTQWLLMLVGLAAVLRAARVNKTKSALR